MCVVAGYRVVDMPIVGFETLIGVQVFEKVGWGFDAP